MERGKKNGVPGLKILEKEELKKEEPLISEEVVCALYAPTAAIVNPWEYGIAMAETAAKNGAEILLDSQVTSIERKENFWQIKTKNKEINAKYVINAAGGKRR